MVDHYETPAFRLGKHEWRCVVRDYDIPGFVKTDNPNVYKIVSQSTRCTCWEFRRIGESAWNDRKNWPSYNSDKSDDGLPRGLGRIYQAHESIIKAALRGESIPIPQTADLFASF